MWHEIGENRQQWKTNMTRWFVFLYSYFIIPYIWDSWDWALQESLIQIYMSSILRFELIAYFFLSIKPLIVMKSPLAFIVVTFSKVCSTSTHLIWRIKNQPKWHQTAENEIGVSVKIALIRFAIKPVWEEYIGPFWTEHEKVMLY